MENTQLKSQKMKSLFKQNSNIREEVDSLIETEREKILKAASANGRHWGLQNMPAAQGDKLAPFILQIKTQCEQLALKALHLLKPALHLPQGKIDADWADMHHKRLGGEVDEMDKHIALYRRDLDGYNPAEISKRLAISFLLSLGLFIAEIALNTQAFQVFGDNQLYCLLLAFSVSLAVGLGAHVAGRQFKDAKTTFKRRLVVIVSFICISVFSTVIASLRAQFQQKIGVDINPLDFIIFNIGLFLAAAVAAFYFHPNKDELDWNRDKLQKLKELKKLLIKKQAKVREQVNHELSSKKTLHEHLDSTMSAEYAIERVKGVYGEAVGAFINANMLCRKELSNCFGDTPPPLNIPHITFHSTINKYKNTNHENNNSYYPA